MVNKKLKKDTAAMFARLAGQVEEDTKVEALPSELAQTSKKPQEDVAAPHLETEVEKQDEQPKTSEKITEQTLPVRPEVPSPRPIAIATELQATSATPPRRGRAPGKRSDPNYTQIGAYIPKDLDRAVKRILVDEENLDLSELIAQLLDDWVKRKID
jgi:hypothetical protein